MTETDDQVPEGTDAIDERPPVALRPALEAVLMIADEPLDHLVLAQAVGHPPADVQQALRELGDGAVINAANRFPEVHWLFMAPQPATGEGPLGVVELFRLLLSKLS